jgi:hypothetical protein
MNERAIGDLFAVDPSLNAPGVAWLRAGRVIAADRIRVDADWKELPIGERCQRVAAEINRWGSTYGDPRWLVFEWPQAYYGKDKVDKNDLFGLAGVAMGVAGQLAVALAHRDLSLQVLSPTPKDWAGQLPKSKTGDAWNSPRGKRLRSKIDNDEYFAIGAKATHDAIDSACIGLWAVGRWNPARVYAGTQ